MQKTFIHKHQLLTEAITHKQTYFLQAKTLKIPYPEMCSDVHIHCFLYELIWTLQKPLSSHYASIVDEDVHITNIWLDLHRERKSL